MAPPRGAVATPEHEWELSLQVVAVRHLLVVTLGTWFSELLTSKKQEFDSWNRWFHRIPQNFTTLKLLVSAT